MAFESLDKPKPKEEPGALAQFGDALINSAVQNPFNSLSQIGSAVIGTKLPEMHYFDPAESTTGTGKFAQQAGNVLGMAVPFLISRKAVGWGEARLGIVASGTTLSMAAEQAAIGGFMGLALTPSDQGLTGRLKNATIDAGTFAAMGAASAKLQSRFAFTPEMPLSSRILKSSLIGLASGAGGGLANAELNAVVNKGQAIASFEDVRNDVVSFAALGGIFGAGEAIYAGRTAAKPEPGKIETAKPDTGEPAVVVPVETTGGGIGKDAAVAPTVVDSQARAAEHQSAIDTRAVKLESVDSIPAAFVDRPPSGDSYHDIGMFRQTDAVEGLEGILKNGKITGGTLKGAQVSQNGGPTNWEASHITLRIAATPAELGHLQMDMNSPRFANWFETGMRSIPIDINGKPIEVIVNGSSALDIAARLDAAKAAVVRANASRLEEGLAPMDAKVVSISDFMNNERFPEVAKTLAPADRQEFLDGMRNSPLDAQKAVGTIAAQLPAAEFTQAWEQGWPETMSATKAKIEQNPDLGSDAVSRFQAMVADLSMGEQIALLEALRQERLPQPVFGSRKMEVRWKTPILWGVQQDLLEAGNLSGTLAKLDPPIYRPI